MINLLLVHIKILHFQYLSVIGFSPVRPLVMVSHLLVFRPVMPNTIQAGLMSCNPAQPLDGRLKDWVGKKYFPPVHSLLRSQLNIR